MRTYLLEKSRVVFQEMQMTLITRNKEAVL